MKTQEEFPGQTAGISDWLLGTHTAHSCSRLAADWSTPPLTEHSLQTATARLCTFNIFGFKMLYSIFSSDSFSAQKKEG